MLRWLARGIDLPQKKDILLCATPI